MTMLSVYLIIAHDTMKRGADIQVCVECRHLGIRAWNASFGEHGLRTRKEVSAAG